MIFREDSRTAPGRYIEVLSSQEKAVEIDGEALFEFLGVVPRNGSAGDILTESINDYVAAIPRGGEYYTDIISGVLDGKYNIDQESKKQFAGVFRLIEDIPAHDAQLHPDAYKQVITQAVQSLFQQVVTYVTNANRPTTH